MVTWSTFCKHRNSLFVRWNVVSRNQKSILRLDFSRISQKKRLQRSSEIRRKEKHLLGKTLATKVFQTNPCKFWNFWTVVKSFPYAFKGSNCLLWIKRRIEPLDASGNILWQFKNFEIYKDLYGTNAKGLLIELIPCLYANTFDHARGSWSIKIDIGNQSI